MKIKVIDFFSSDDKGEVELREDIFSSEVRKDILARVVKWQMDKKRGGNHKTKGRSEVNHTTKKPFKQKGTGNARQGMKGVSQMRGGGVVFGPVVRDHSHKLNKKVRQIGLKSALTSKLKNSKLMIVDNVSIQKVNTKSIIENLKRLNLNNVLFVDENNLNNSCNFSLSIKNIYKVDFLPVIGLNVYDILNHENIVITKKGIDGIGERLSG